MFGWKDVTPALMTRGILVQFHWDCWRGELSTGWAVVYSCCLSGGQWCTAVVYGVGSGVQLLSMGWAVVYWCCLSGGQWCTAVVYRVGIGVPVLSIGWAVVYSCCLSGGDWCTGVVYRVGSGVQLLSIGWAVVYSCCLSGGQWCTAVEIIPCFAMSGRYLSVQRCSICMYILYIYCNSVSASY